MTARTHPTDAGWTRARQFALARLQQACDALTHAVAGDGPAAQLALTRAVHAAREDHCSWGDIANVLGVARGNAYQRYRVKPGAPALGQDTPLPGAPPL